MADTLEIFGVEYTNVAGIIATTPNETDLTYIRPQGTKSISANGTGIDVAEYASVDVNVPSGQPTLQSKTYNVTSAGTSTVTADSGYDGLSSVSVSVSEVGLQAGFLEDNIEVSVNSSGLIDASYSNQISVDPTANSGWLEKGTKTIPVYIGLDGTYQLPTQAATTITPTESTQTAVTAGKYTTGAVTVNAIPTDYVGTGITRRSSSDLTVSGATVTVPAGYYSAAASKSVSSMTLPTSVASSATSGYTSKATIGRSTAAQYINIPPGYNSAGAYYVISAVANGSATAPASISGTAASVSTGTNTLTLTKTVSVTPTVSAGYVSTGTAGNSSVSLTASVTTKAAATITPTTTNQTIAAGTYLTGTQTIAGDADLVGSNILSTANIFGVQGTVDFIDVYIRSTAPTSSVGSDGDIYIQE